MSSIEHMLCQGGCLDVPILHCLAVLTDTLLEAPPSLADVHARALHTRDGVRNSFAFFNWDWVLWAYQHLAESP